MATNKAKAAFAYCFHEKCETKTATKKLVPNTFPSSTRGNASMRFPVWCEYVRKISRNSYDARSQSCPPKKMQAAPRPIHHSKKGGTSDPSPCFVIQNTHVRCRGNFPTSLKNILPSSRAGLQRAENDFFSAQLVKHASAQKNLLVLFFALGSLPHSHGQFHIKIQNYSRTMHKL